MAALTLTMLSVSHSAFLSHLPLGKEKLCYNYALLTHKLLHGMCRTLHRGFQSYESTMKKTQVSLFLPDKGRTGRENRRRLVTRLSG